MTAVERRYLALLGLIVLAAICMAVALALIPPALPAGARGNYTNTPPPPPPTDAPTATATRAIYPGPVVTATPNPYPAWGNK